MWRPNFDALSQIDNRVLNDADGTRIENRDYKTMDQLLMEIADRYNEVREQDGASDPGTLTMLQNDYQNVLQQVMDGYGLQEAPEGLEPSSLAGINEDELSTTPPVPGEDTTAKADEQPSLMPLEEFGQILRHGQQVDALSTDDKTRVSELILGAQDKLHTGEYYWAERRFNRALRLEPGNPLATAGLAHAQLGGGLYLTSALTLQSLLGFQPEMIDVVYSDTLLPLPEDLERAVRELNRRITSEKDSDRYAFLLAYIGHQTDNPALVQQGLREMRRVQGDEAFLQLLEQIWLPDRTPVVEEAELIPLEPVEPSDAAPKDDTSEPPAEPVGGDLLDD